MIPDEDNSSPAWLPGFMPDKTTLDYLAVTGTVIALGALFLLATGILKGEHLKRAGFSGIGGAGT
jgi:hypothetical protein